MGCVVMGRLSEAGASGDRERQFQETAHDTA